MEDLLIRPAIEKDLDTLWDFLALAAYEPDVEAAKSVPIVAAHLEGWKREQDFGFIAERAGAAIGAAWARQFSPEEGSPFYMGETTPEVSIAVKEGSRERGVGRTLLGAVIEEAQRRGVRLCLNVRHDNIARRLYERAGFSAVPQSVVPNRAGGLSIGMILDPCGAASRSGT